MHGLFVNIVIQHVQSILYKLAAYLMWPFYCLFCSLNKCQQCITKLISIERTAFSTLEMSRLSYPIIHFYMLKDTTILKLNQIPSSVEVAEF